MDMIKLDSEVISACNDILAEDILLGKISVMQPLSEMVQKQEEVRPGDIVNTLTKKVVATKGSSVEVIVLKSFKYWIEYEVLATGEEKYVKRVPAHSINELPFTEGNTKRVFNHAFYVLLPTDMTMPVELSFKSSELRTAKKLASFIFKLGVLKKHSFDLCFNLTSAIRQREKYMWYGLEVSEGRVTTEEEKTQAIMWCKQLSAAATVAVQEHEVEPANIPNEELF